MSNEVNEVNEVEKKEKKKQGTVETEETIIDPVELALLGMKVAVGENGGALRNGDPNAKYRLVLRSLKRSGETPERAKSLKACKGKKGCEFAQCVENAFGKLPTNLKGLCLTDSKK